VMTAPLDEVDEIVALRKQEADEFYTAIHPPLATPTNASCSVRRSRDVVDEAGVSVRCPRVARRRQSHHRPRPAAVRSATRRGAI
jgi:hypothetical protein